MIRIFIGFDPAESVAYHVLANSIIMRSSEPVSITPVGNKVLGGYWNRPRGPKDSTDFSNARWAVPQLCDYQGFAIFVDCDMICAGDIADLWAQKDPTKAVVVRKHEQEVTQPTKFLGNKQFAYNRKNWSSLMIINCAHPYWLRIDAEHDDGLKLHQFHGLEDDEIGEITGSWNELLDVDPAYDDDWAYNPPPELAHFTLGGPWHGWTRYVEAELWTKELRDMLSGDNPCAHINVSADRKGVYIGGAYHVLRQDEEAEAQAGASTAG